MPSPSQNSELPGDLGKTVDSFDGRGPEIFHLYIKAWRNGRKAAAQEILADSDLTSDEQVRRLRDIIRNLEF